MLFAVLMLKIVSAFTSNLLCTCYQCGLLFMFPQTIIECLKYMTTGEMPPGGRNGAAFIHDPKVGSYFVNSS
jgi:hypothetical protein